MALPRNRRSIADAFTGFDKTLRDIFVEQPKSYYAELRRKLRDLPRTNFDLGCDFASQGKWQDAAFRFRVALYFQPKFAAAQYNLGCCLLKLNQKAKAKGAFLRALQMQPGYSDALFMLSAVDPGAVPPNQRPQRMPVEMVQQFFAGMAAQYDAVEASNQYQGGRIAYDAAKPFLPAGSKDLTVIDLASGTGIVSRPWRPIAKEIVAIDSSPAMANAARLVKVADAPLFDRVLEEDVFDVTASAAPFLAADVVLLVNSAQFIGTLEPLLKSLGTAMKPGALLVLTLEPYSASGGYGVNLDTGRFGHQPEAVKQQALASGFAVKQESRVNLYPSFNAFLLVLGKNQ